MGNAVNPSSRVHRHDINPAGLPWSLPVLTVESQADGPRAVVCANLHGDESIGIGVVHRLLERLPDALLRGSVRLYPSLNPEGLRAGSRRAPGERTDLNRAFPGDARGSVAERIAHAVWHDIMDFGPAVALDLHADSSASIPYAIVDRLINAREPERSRRLGRLERLARSAGLTVVHDYPDGPYRHFQLDRSLSGALLNHGKIEAFTLELGPRRLLLPEAVRSGFEAVSGVLAELGLVAAEPTRHVSQVGGGPWRRDSGPSPRSGGVLRHLRDPGELLEAGMDLASIHHLDGQLKERVVVTERSLVLSLAERAWIAVGESIATLAVPDN
jgi:predicted deacylase